MNTYQAYQYQCERLTAEQKIQLNMKENNIGRKLLPSEISAIFKLTPYTEERQPRKRRMSDEVEQDSHWMDQ